MPCVIAYGSRGVAQFMEASQRYSPGLKGVIAGETSISRVEPQAGLVYRGYEIQQLAAHASYEEIVWLLWHGELPSTEERGKLSRQLAQERHLPGPIMDLLLLNPAEAHPMDSLRTAVSMLGMFDAELKDRSPEANLRKSIRLVSKVASVVTSGWRLARGKDLLPPSGSLNHAGNFLYQLNGEVPEMHSIEALDTVLILYGDHGFNASTFAARVTASTLADIYAAVTTALGTLKGPLHGGANEQAMNMLREIGAPQNVEPWVRTRLARKEKIAGFGHRVYQTGDARVPIMRKLAQELGERTGETNWVRICGELEKVMEREKQLYANVDLYAAPVFFLLGIPPELNTAIFACARVAGWCGHVMEQHQNNCLIRPRCHYTGPAPRGYPIGLKKSAA